MNNVTLMGRLTKTPELKTTTSGIEVTSFSIAVDRNFDREKTDFINIVAWRKTAEFICKYFRKGDMIAITGEIQTRDYEDKSGQKRNAVEVIANQVYFCGKNNEEKEESKPVENIDFDEELPF